MKNYIPPVTDELLDSYIFRLAAANGFSNASLRAYLRQKGAGLNYDRLCGEILEGTDVQKAAFFAEHTIYPFISAFMTREKQAHFINLAFRDKNKYPRILTKNSTAFSEYKCCGECVKETGFFWLNRVYHIPGVKVCPKHGVELAVYKGIDFLDPDKYTLKGEEITDLNFKYAVFAESLLSLDTDIKHISKAIFRRCKELGLSAETIAEAIHKAGLDSLFTVDLKEFMRVTLISPQYVDAVNCTALLLFLFEDAETLKKYLEPDTAVRKQFLSDMEGYEVAEPYRDSIIEMRHMSCGTEFVTTPAGFSNGWRCPICESSSEDEKFAELVQLTGHGEYELTSTFSGMDRKITLKHTCGRDLSVKARAFLEEGSRCICESTVTFEKAQETVSSLGDFKLIKYTGTEKPVRIRHLGCGKEFTVPRYMTFIQHPHCHICEPRFFRSEEIFKTEIEELTGDEYTLIGHYTDKDTPVEIRHNACGKTKAYLPRHFLDGSRCTYCSRNLPDKEFFGWFEATTCGRYTAEKYTENLYSVHDTKTGKELHLSKQQILQEINRPTPSPVLPGRKKKVVKTATLKDQIFEFMKNNADDDGLVFLSDITLDAPYAQIKARTQDLASEGLVFRVALGIYSLENREYDPDTLIKAKYIMRNGQNIGFYDDLPYEFGLTDEPSKRLSIVTNLEPSAGRTMKAFGKQIRLKGATAVINNDNVQTLKILHLISHSRVRPEDISRILKENEIEEEKFAAYLGLYPERAGDILREAYGKVI